MHIKNSSKKFTAWELLAYGKKNIKRFKKVTILHISHLNKDILKEYNNNNLVRIYDLIKLDKKNILINSRVKQHLHILENKCKRSTVIKK